MIQDLLNKLASVRYGRDMRQTIIDAIKQCYEDATGNPDSISAAVEKVSELTTKVTNLTTRTSALESANNAHNEFEQDTEEELSAIKTDVTNLKNSTEKKELSIESDFSAGTYGCKGVYATKINGRVFVDFSVIKTDAWNGDAALIATIPTGWRPKGLEYLIVPTAGARIARISVSPDGELRLGMVRFLTDGVQDTTTAGLWLQGSINYEPA